MSVEKLLADRSGGNCELCGASGAKNVYIVAPKDGTDVSDCVQTCSTCQSQLEDASIVEPNHWRCLNDSMWSEVDAVKVVAYRMLNQLKGEGWPNDLIDMMYMEDDIMKWAKQGMIDPDAPKHVDSNGSLLQNGDTVVLIKDLDVKGAGFTAKRGTAVRNIRLVHDNHEHIEGKVNGQGIVILTQYVKK